jgi:hypothetical protein
LEGRHQEDHDYRPAQAKTWRDLFSTNDRAWWHTPVIPAMWGSTNRRIMVQASLSIKWDLISKITKAKVLEAWLK